MSNLLLPIDGELAVCGEAEPAVIPISIVVRQDARGEQTLDVQEPHLERQYTLSDPYTRALFIALCRHEGVTMYRRPRQRQSTVCVRAPLSVHEELLWPRFLGLCDKLEARLSEWTHEFVRQEICDKGAAK